MICVRFLTFLTALTFSVDGFRPDVLVEKGNYSNFHVVIDENVRVDTCKSITILKNNFFPSVLHIAKKGLTDFFFRPVQKHKRPDKPD